MSENEPTGMNDETRPIAATPEPEAAPAAPPAATPPAGSDPGRSSHTRTILEVVGGVVAAGLIVVAGFVGFAVGHGTGDDRREGRGGPDGYALEGPGAQGFGQDRSDRGDHGDRGGRGGHHDDDGWGQPPAMPQPPATPQPPAPSSSPAA